MQNPDGSVHLPSAGVTGTSSTATAFRVVMLPTCTADLWRLPRAVHVGRGSAPSAPTTDPTAERCRPVPQPVFKPTDEQQNALDLFRSGGNVTIDALAGTGKTSTLQLLAGADTRRGLYVAFNKAIASEAQRKFNGTGVLAKTMHSLAYAQFGASMQHRLSNRRPVQWSEKASILRINDKYVLPPNSGAMAGALSRQKLVGMTTKTVEAFMRSGAREITADLVEIPVDIAGIKEAPAQKLKETVAEFARRYWEDLSRPDGQLKYTHDAYYKAWHLSEPVLPYDFIMLDEAQDADALITDVLSRQAAQIVTVGDRYQQIYSWRGASMSLDAYDGARTALTMSFRFGDQIAEYANGWLDLMGADLRLRGLPGKPSSVFAAHKRDPEAILTRTNAQAIMEIVQSQEKGLDTGIAGERKAKEIHELAQAALDLQSKGWTRHPELEPFNTWRDVIEYAESDDGADMKPLVDVIELYTAPVVMKAIDRCVPTDRARTVVSTAHVAKGLEWMQVRISEDFREPRAKKGVVQPIPAEEARLAYVAATRAQRHLDARGLDWVPGYIAQGGWVEGNAPQTVHVEAEATADALEARAGDREKAAR